eukprot:m.37511 g.37511  ORF g.37511 m.37511 type:complete len:55 (-) comp9830_c0_seq2:346-510(-)
MPCHYCFPPSMVCFEFGTFSFSNCPHFTRSSPARSFASYHLSIFSIYISFPVMS